ncbi:MFS transporter [Escherichia coli]|uniref:MFS transporter n=1 Tax=Escherichia coli TaxID=562 RepID=UPI001894D170
MQQFFCRSNSQRRYFWLRVSAGLGCLISYAEKVARNFHFEYGTARAEDLLAMLLARSLPAYF